MLDWKTPSRGARVTRVTGHPLTAASVMCDGHFGRDGGLIFLAPARDRLNCQCVGVGRQSRTAIACNTHCAHEVLTPVACCLARLPPPGVPRTAHLRGGAVRGHPAFGGAARV